MRKWDDVIKDALSMYLHSDQYAYFYGAKGQVLSWDVMNTLWNTYYNSYFKDRYSDKDKADIFSWSYGKVGYDCSGYISKITGCNADSYSIFSKCTGKSTDLSKGVAGSLLWKPSHIGIDIGYGYFLHMGREMHSVEMGRLSEHTVDWQKCGQLSSYIDYEGSNNR